VNVLLLHAFPLSERMWEPQLEALGGHEVRAPTLYPMGSSMEAWAEAILADFEDPFVACGASMGGYCALALARLAPERVAGLILAGARLEADSPERREGRAGTIELIRSGGAEALWEDIGPKLFPPDAGAELFARARGIALEQAPDSLVAGVEAIRDRPDSTAAVAKLDAPVVHAIGEHDPFVSPGEAEGYPGRLEVFENSGHLVSMQRPERFNRLLLDMLDEL
jgi:pimeloyl-ACP methyl ester carboxylesterase